MKLLVISILLFCTRTSIAQQANAIEFYATKDGAIKGYDPVAYFTLSQPVKGSSSINYKWSGTIWYFSSIENKKFFEANPEKYAPQYGGYCAYGWAQGSKVKIEPDQWAIEGGKLYLNYSKDIQKKWDKDRTKFIQKANENFSKH